MSAVVSCGEAHAPPLKAATSNTPIFPHHSTKQVCYSWWCLSCLSILGRLHWIDRSALTTFILDCQDEEDGGISDRPDDMADVYHTFFGIAGLSLMGYPNLAAIDPTWALPVEVVERIKRRNEAAASASGK